MNIYEEAQQSEIIFDRYLDSEVVLPHDFEQIKIQANDTVSSELLNIKMQHLYDNFLYLYQQTLIASNVIPVSSTAIAGITGNDANVTFYYNASTSQFVPLSSVANFTGVDNSNSMVLVKNRDLDQYTLFSGYETTLRAYNFDTAASYFFNSYISSEVNPGFGVGFVCLTAMTVNNDYLFAVDSGLHRVIKYDISGFTSDNNILRNKLVYLDSIGNLGTFNSKTEFNSPRGVAVYNNYVFVLDSGNSSIKKYDVNLNWIATYKLYNDFLSAYPIDLSVDSIGNLYVLTQNKSFILRYNNDLSKKEIFDLAPLKLQNESFIKIVFSQENTNVFYLVSTRNIYKKLVSNPYNTVGRYLLYLFKYDVPDEKFTTFASASSVGADRNIIFSRFGNTGKFGYFYDNLNLYDILAVNNFDIYNFDDIKFNSNEYLQSWVFNKNISKVVINHMRLRDQIIGKFLAVKDARGNVTFRGTRYLLPFELNSLNFEYDTTYCIGANEILLNNIVNRAFKKIYNIQEVLINILKAEKNTSPLENNPVNLN